MGDRYTMDLDCAYCEHRNENVWYAPSCGSLSFKCEKCGEENWISQGFFAEKISKEELTERYRLEGFETEI